MLNMDNVQAVDTEESECVVCDEKIKKDAHPKMLRITFKLIVKVSKSIHLDCAKELVHLIEAKIAEAKR